MTLVSGSVRHSNQRSLRLCRSSQMEISMSMVLTRPPTSLSHGASRSLALNSTPINPSLKSSCPPVTQSNTSMSSRLSCITAIMCSSQEKLVSVNQSSPRTSYSLLLRMLCMLSSTSLVKLQPRISRMHSKETSRPRERLCWGPQVVKR
jgi:hypothetical protein